MTHSYHSGRGLEQRVKTILKEMGYFVVRSAGSKSPADLVALKQRSTETGPRVLLVQCKYCKYVEVEEWNALFDLAHETRAMPIVAWVPKRRAPLEIYQLIGVKEARGHRPWELWTVDGG